ncbi:hypothetical protein [Xanthomonas sp. MUS 060]|uniref:hypothetical protein n=1 Tax=Xanthomonas sp. MUS 060 TaxID=1588031 RepID=UPI0005F27A10|nr:hypothetical protein [Xanthomonas sp. MUS 060]
MVNGRRHDHLPGGRGIGVVGDARVVTLSPCQGAHCVQVEGIRWPMLIECGLELKPQIDAVVAKALCRFRGLFERVDLAWFRSAWDA